MRKTAKGRKEKRGEWVVPGGKAGELGWCMRCGVGLAFLGPMSLYLAASYMKAFAHHHAHCQDVGYQEPVPKTQEEWVRSRDVGVSSGTIYAAASGQLSPYPAHFDVPHDPEDFGRCYRLLKLFPEMREHLAKTVYLCLKWKPFVDAWDELTSIYERALNAASGSASADDDAHKLYDRIQQLQGRAL